VAHADDTADAYRRFAPALVRKAERILQNRDDALDIVHGLFVEMMRPRRWSAPPTGALELPYLYRAITNRCLNHLRDRANRADLLARQEPALRGCARTRCDDQVIGLDLLAKLATRLDRRSLEILVYRYVDDMSQDEIAALIGASRKTVGKRMQIIRAAVGELSA
jgi:RNA polymerase sigma-70 factor (ECF subfamily)